MWEVTEPWGRDSNAYKTEEEEGEEGKEGEEGDEREEGEEEEEEEEGDFSPKTDTVTCL